MLALWRPAALLQNALSGQQQELEMTKLRTDKRRFT